MTCFFSKNRIFLNIMHLGSSQLPTYRDDSYSHRKNRYTCEQFCRAIGILIIISLIYWFIIRVILNV